MRRRVLLACAFAASGCSVILGLDDAVVEPPEQSVTPADSSVDSSVSLVDTGIASPDTSSNAEDGMHDDVTRADVASDTKMDANDSD